MAPRPLEEKVKEAFEHWLMIEKALSCHPVEETIFAKEKELIINISNT